jgi:hypothetical protein
VKVKILGYKRPDSGTWGVIEAHLEGTEKTDRQFARAVMMGMSKDYWKLFEAEAPDGMTIKQIKEHFMKNEPYYDCVAYKDDEDCNGIVYRKIG